MKHDALATAASDAASALLGCPTRVRRHRYVSWLNSETRGGIMFVGIDYMGARPATLVEVFYRSPETDDADCAFIGLNIVDVQTVCLDDNALVYKTLLGSERRIQTESDFVHAVIALTRQLEEAARHAPLVDELA